MRFPLVLFFLQFSLLSIHSEFSQHRTEILAADGSYVLHWSIDYVAKVVRFNATVATRGYVGFGISPSGGMTGADIVIGGIFENGTAYFSDRHAVGESLPIVDKAQNWDLLNATETTDGVTTLIFERAFNTCDDEDVVLSNDTTNFIWAYSPTNSDDVVYHTSGFRGTLTVQPLDPEVPPLDPGHWSQYDIKHTMTMPDADTTYWCTIHRSPVFTEKHHIVAFEPLLTSSEAIAHTHHYNIFRCTPPDGVDAETFFGPHVDAGVGGECYVAQPEVPTAYCQTMFYNWAVGGRTLVLPPNIGYPIGETGNPVDYYMFEIHYNNPTRLQNVTFETGAIIYYTPELRQHDAGLMVVAHHTSLSLTVPPNSTGFKTAGHCDSACTEEYLPEEGINVFAIFLHAHLSGRKMKFRQFRGDQELPWAANDDTYDFEFQQTRPLSKELKILRGDHLTMECTYDTTWYDQSKVVIGGLSTTNEMCQSIFWYYPRAELRDCRSEYPTEEIFAKFGIESANRSTPYEDAIITAPTSLAGMSYTEVLNTRVDWTSELRKAIEQDSLTRPHVGVCWTASETKNIDQIGYPSGIVREYAPRDECNSSLANRLVLTVPIFLGMIFSLIEIV